MLTSKITIFEVWNRLYIFIIKCLPIIDNTLLQDKIRPTRADFFEWNAFVRTL